VTQLKKIPIKSVLQKCDKIANNRAKDQPIENNLKQA